MKWDLDRKERKVKWSKSDIEHLKLVKWVEEGEKLIDEHRKIMAEYKRLEVIPYDKNKYDELKKRSDLNATKMAYHSSTKTK